MQVIMISKVENLGRLGDKRNVKAGYARNFLVPKGKVIPATKKNQYFLEKCIYELAYKQNEFFAISEIRAVKINNIQEITIFSQYREGKLFGSIVPKDISDTITAAGVPVDKKEVLFIHGILRTTGKHQLHFPVHTSVCATINVIIC